MADELNDPNLPPPLPDGGENQRQADAAAQTDAGGLGELGAAAAEAGFEALGAISDAAGQAADMAGEAAGAAAEAAGSVVGAAAEGASGCSCSVIVLLALCLSAGSAVAAVLIR